MKIAIQYTDALGNVIQFKTAIDTFRQVEEKSCWIVESRKVFPQLTEWSCVNSFENQFFETEEEALDAVRQQALAYADKAKKIGKTVKVEEVVL